jgi:hypothetical protein
VSAVVATAASGSVTGSGAVARLFFGRGKKIPRPSRVHLVGDMEKDKIF